MAAARAEALGLMRDWVGLFYWRVFAQDSRVEIRDLFSGMTHQAIYCWTPASLSLPLIV
jgi:hypothetical protein